jgi:hypothetical protein
MRSSYLEVTYREGRAIAAYYYLPRKARDRAVKSRREELGLIVDFARDGRPIGIEITAPAALTLAAMNRVLRKLNVSPIHKIDLSPLRAA